MTKATKAVMDLISALPAESKGLGLGVAMILEGQELIEGDYVDTYLDGCRVRYPEQYGEILATAVRTMREISGFSTKE